MKKECPYCKQTIHFDYPKQFSSHCGNCKEGPNYKRKVELQKQKILGKRKEYSFNCKKCRKEYSVNLTLHQYKNKNYKKHCSQVCSNSHIQTEEQNKRRRKKLLGREITKREIRICKCGRKFKCNVRKKYQTCELHRKMATHMIHTKLEKKLKPSLEKYLGTKNLQSQKLGKYWFDFVNKEYIIEYTNSVTGGFNNTIKRFETIVNDKRKKYVVVPNFYIGEKRLKKLLKINVEIIPKENVVGGVLDA